MGPGGTETSVNTHKNQHLVDNAAKLCFQCGIEFGSLDHGCIGLSVLMSSKGSSPSVGMGEGGPIALAIMKWLQMKILVPS